MKPFDLIAAARALALCSLIALTGPILAGPAHAETPVTQVLDLALGDAQVIDTDFDLADVVVGRDTVASVVVLSSRSLVITPLAAGATEVILRDASGQERQRLSVIVSETFAQLQAILDETVPGGTVHVRNVNGRALVSGSVATEADAAQVLDIAKSYSQGDVIDALKVADPRQVMLKVNILELSRTAGKELGINTFDNPQGMESVNGTPYGVISQTLRLAPSAGTSVDLLLQALENKGMARRLANPTLVTVNGAMASFVVGGEVPIVTSTPDKGPTTTYREYGVKLAFTPQILPEGAIRMTILPEVSEVDWTRRVNDNPAFVSRKVETTLELTSGKSFAIAGLLQKDSVRSARQFPWMGDVPILGALFRSSAYQKNETELVVIVTPYLVNGASPEAVMGDPTAQTQDPSDAATFLLGAVEDTAEMTRRFQSGFGVTGPFGHILPVK